MSEMRVNAYFEPADNKVVELTNDERSVQVDFGVPSHVAAISVSHGNDEYVIVRLRKPEDTRPFWSAKFLSGLNGQVFFQPIPGTPPSQVVVEVEPKEGTQLTDSVLVNLSYIRAR